VASGDVTSIYEHVTSIGGHAYTVVSSDGGKAFTIATSDAGVVTSVGNSVFTAATGSLPTSSKGAAYALRVGAGGYLSGPVTVALVAVFTGALAGARLIL